MSELSEDSSTFYEATLRESKKQIEIIDARIDEEVARFDEVAARFKEIIDKLKEQQKAVRQIYDGAALVLGVKNEFEDEHRKESQ